MQNLKAKLVLSILLTVLVFNLAAYAQKAELVVQTGHSGAIRSLTFSPDGKLLASVGNDNTVRIWDVQTGQELRNFSGHNGSISAVEFSPSGTLLATVSHAEGVAKVWDIEAATERWSVSFNKKSGYSGSDKQKHTISFSPDEKHLAVGKDEDFDDLLPPPPPPLPPPPPMPLKRPDESAEDYEKKLALNRDEYEKKLALSKLDLLRPFSVVIFDVKTGKTINELLGHLNYVTFVKFLNNGKDLISADRSRNVKIWNVETGKEKLSFPPVERNIKMLAVSPNEEYVTTVLEKKDRYDKKEKIVAKVLDIGTGQEIKTIQLEGSGVVEYSADSKQLLDLETDKISQWSIETGNNELRLISFLDRWLTENQKQEIDAEKSEAAKDQYLAQIQKVFPAKVKPEMTDKLLGEIERILSPKLVEWKKKYGNVISEYLRSSITNFIEWKWVETTDSGASGGGFAASEPYNFPGLISSFGASNTLFATAYDTEIKVWNWESKIQLLKISSNIRMPGSPLLSSDGKTLLIGNLLLRPEKGVRFIDLGYSSSASFSPDGKVLALEFSEWSEEKKRSEYFIRLIEVESQKEITKIAIEGFSNIIFSPAGDLIAASTSNGIKIFDARNGKITGFLSDLEQPALLTFSPNAEILYFSSRADQKRLLRLWKIGTNQLVASTSEISFDKLAFSKDGKWRASAGDSLGKSNIFLINEQNGEAKWLDGSKPEDIRELQRVIPEYFINPPNRYGNKDIRISADGKWQVLKTVDGRIRFRDFQTQQDVADLVLLKNDNWVVTTPNGLFDASPEARKLMHYAVGLEPISLEQMKDVYYVPGLLQKIFKGEPLPKVELFSKQDLFPSVEYEPLKAGQKQLKVKFTNRGGGIGQVQVLVNGKEFLKDARPARFNSTSPSAAITVDLTDASIKPGEENKIEIVARNAAGSLSTRGTRGAEIVYTDIGKKQTETPNIYAIIGGISNYTGDNLKLNYAAKDAEDFARAIEVGATKLIGDKSKVHIRLLTSNGDSSGVKFTSPDAKISTATKAGFQNAFSDFRNATPNDVFIVYLAGHGVSLNLNQNPGQTGGDTYLYLTQEATTTDKSVLSAENSRKAMAISSEEITDFMKQNKSLKQVLILDTCAAGALSNSLIGKRDLPSDQIKAMETLKDNTGFYVLMGASADAVSYEASQYGQGLLTYSLLQGMKGAKLRDGSFAFVADLFGYAQEKVPEMAKNIGGIQRPITITPDASGNFPIGRFTAVEQGKIPLSSPKPVILRPNLRNSTLRFDNLKLTQVMTEQLRQAGYAQTRGEMNPIVFVQADEMADAIQPVGDYTIAGDTIKITLLLVKNNAPIGKEITVTGNVNDPEAAIKQLIKTIMQFL